MNSENHVDRENFENKQENEINEIAGNSADVNAGDSRILSLTEELAQAKDKYLRLSAEFDNYRKRTLNEKYELIKNAGEDVIKSLLPVIDDFDRAFEAISKSADVEALIRGTELIYDKFLSVLKSKGLSLIDAANKDFDPDTHEAVAKTPSVAGKGKVVDVLQKGYSLNDKIIRYPKVVVGE